MISPPAAVVTGALGEEAAASNEGIVVVLGQSRFAVALVAVAEVGRVPTLTRVPGVPGWLAGVANWRGRILPVLDLRRLLGVERSDRPAGQARLLVLADSGVAAGLLVDAVEGTTWLEDIAMLPPAGVPDGGDLLSGQMPRAEGPVAVLDVPAVLRLRDALPRRRHSLQAR